MAEITVGVRFNAGPIQRLSRDLRGRFTKAQGALTSAHADAAYFVAREMQEVLDEKVRARERTRNFPMRPTRHLYHALTQEGNWRAGYGGFSAGIASHLDRSPAREYWRNLEEGTSLFRGRLLWMTPAGPRDPINWLHGFGGPGGYARGRYPTARVERGIEGYHFLREGARRGASRLRAGHMRAIYEDYFQDLPMALTERGITLPRSTGGRFAVMPG